MDVVVLGHPTNTPPIPNGYVRTATIVHGTVHAVLKGGRFCAASMTSRSLAASAARETALCLLPPPQVRLRQRQRLKKMPVVTRTLMPGRNPRGMCVAILLKACACYVE